MSRSVIARIKDDTASTDLPPDLGSLRVVAIAAAEGVTGPGRQLASVASRLHALGIDIRVIVLWRRGHREPPFLALLRRVGVPCETIADHGAFDLTLPGRLSTALERIRPNIVQTHGYKATAAVWTLKVRRALTVPWIGFFHGATRESFRARLYHWLDTRMLVSGAERVIVMSGAQKAAVGPSDPKVRVIYNAVVPEVVLPSKLQAERSLSERLAELPRPRLAVVGRLSPEKGVEVLFRAASILRQRGHTPTILVAGSGPARAQLESLRRSLGLEDSIVFLGDVENVADVYAAADLIVIPSYSEGLPNVLLEALAADLPIVATRVGAIPEVLTDARAGSLVDPGNPTRLAEAIAAMLSDSPSSGSNARAAIASRFSIESRVDAHVALYTELVGLSGVIGAH